MRPVYVIGVGMTPFRSPRNSPDYVALGSAAIQEALGDARIGYSAVEQVFASYVFGDSCSGHRVVYEVGLSGIPIFNINSNCSSGASALFLARQAVATGAADCVLAVGFEQMQTGALASNWIDRPSVVERFIAVADGWVDRDESPLTPRFFGAAAREYQRRYGTSAETFAAISVKNRRHGTANVKAFLREPLTTEQVLSSAMVCDPLTRFQCCPPTSGGAAVIVCSESFIKTSEAPRPVRIAGQVLITDFPSSFAGSAPEGFVTH